MTSPNQGSQPAHMNESAYNATLEFRVRPQVHYGVTRFTEAEGSTPLVDKLSLDQANIIAQAYGEKHPGSRVTLIQEDRRRFDTLLLKTVGGDGPEVNVYQRLLELPGGSRITCWLEHREPASPSLVVDWNIPRTQADVPQKHEPEWLFGDLVIREFETAKTSLGSLPYVVAAAMRRNAREAGDATMLRLLDEAQVAVDA